MNILGTDFPNWEGQHAGEGARATCGFTGSAATSRSYSARQSRIGVFTLVAISAINVVTY
jgi:hypothetical protein